MELHKDDAAGNYSVRAFQQAGSMDQIRQLSIQHGTEEMMRSQLSLSGCSQPFDCPLDEFALKLAQRISTKCINSKLAVFVDDVIAADANCESSGGGVPVWVVLLVAGISLVPVWAAYRYYSLFRAAKGALRDRLSVDETPYHYMEPDNSKIMMETSS